ncbi:hypothetical protein [Streptomyces sp. WAC08241]|uniref:hypothetical protein n=1 Tax=Streptomyces sp. WAC08241 TaxID=2487421 RepID=UPI000F76871D|nr:hypothetical protein [Streptomyces sp. WAC08241]RSS40947.1 hypothetical protein EF906_15640 [Streptomyces sp. WAC08241]
MKYREGDVVVDGTRALVGRVRVVGRSFLTLTRPGGAEWTATPENCWTASPEERASITLRGAVQVISTASESSAPVSPSS